MTGHAAAALLHVIWLFSPWPLPDWPTWSRAFGRDGFRVSWPIMSGVALLSALAGYLVGVRAGLFRSRLPSWLVGATVLGIAAILTGRAVLGWIEMSHQLGGPRMTEVFRRTVLNYLTTYLPVFALLGVTSGYVVWRAGATGE